MFIIRFESIPEKAMTVPCRWSSALRQRLQRGPAGTGGRWRVRALRARVRPGAPGSGFGASPGVTLPCSQPPDSYGIFYNRGKNRGKYFLPHP